MLKDKHTYVKKDDMKAHKGNIKMSLVRNKSILTATIILSISPHKRAHVIHLNLSLCHSSPMAVLMMSARLSLAASSNLVTASLQDLFCEQRRSTADQ